MATKEVVAKVGSTKELAMRLGVVRTRSLKGGQAARASMQVPTATELAS